MATRTIRIRIEGRVQGVSYRFWAREEARRLGLSGWVRNRPDGSVEALVSGEPDAVGRMLARCREGPPAARVSGVATIAEGGPAPGNFEILHDG
jgi:acylphosphatase